MKLTPFHDEDNITRITGRLKNSPIFNNGRVHPKLLSDKHKVSELIVRDVHEKTFHPGHLRVIAECRKDYLIIGLGYMAKSIGEKYALYVGGGANYFYINLWQIYRFSEYHQDHPILQWTNLDRLLLGLDEEKGPNHMERYSFGYIR